MDLRAVAVLAGSASATLFVVSYLPMLVRAVRTRDLRSYSRSSLVIANVGNVVQSCYVVSLPVGPLWFLHGFYLVSSAFMLGLHLRHGAATADRHEFRQSTENGESSTADVRESRQVTENGVSRTADVRESRQVTENGVSSTAGVREFRQSTENGVSRTADGRESRQVTENAAPPDPPAPTKAVR